MNMSGQENSSILVEVSEQGTVLHFKIKLHIILLLSERIQCQTTNKYTNKNIQISFPCTNPCAGIASTDTYHLT